MAQAEIQRRSVVAPGDAFRVTGLGLGLPIVPASQQSNAALAGNGSLWSDDNGVPYVVRGGVSSSILNASFGQFNWTPTLLDDGGAITFTVRMVGSAFVNTAFAQALSGSPGQCTLRGRLQILTRVGGAGGGGLLLTGSGGTLPFAPLSGGALGQQYSSIGVVAFNGAGASISTQAFARIDSSIDAIQLLRYNNGNIFNDLCPHVDAGDTIDFTITYPVTWNP